MGMIDTHAHLTSEPLMTRIDEVLANARAAGVETIISVATDVADAEKAIALARREPDVHATAGIHPHEASKVEPDDWPKLETLLADPQVVAFGEIGLDYHYDFSDPPTQRRVFARQLELATVRDLPVIIHCREAMSDTVSLLVDHGFNNRRVVFHCFSGSADEAALVADHGWRISFTGMVTFKKSQALQQIAAAYPADRLMLETDSPYLSPEPVRNKRPNEPAHLRHLADFLAGLRSESVDTLIRQTTTNARAFFGLPSRT
ncbi:MAG: TatD family hydrolase [Planctomycetes bacterium]|nr:TatD family hydrolase [Planctomycetota bacterium]